MATPGELLGTLRKVSELAFEPDGLRSAIAVLVDDLGFDVAALWRPSADRSELHLTTAWCRPGTRTERFAAAAAGLTPGPGDDVVGRVWEAGRPIWIPDIRQTEWAQDHHALEAGLRCLFALPLVHAGEGVGALELFGRDARPEDATLLENATLIGQPIAAASATADQHGSLQALADASAQAALILDGDYRVVSCNASGARIWGLSSERLVGAHLLDLFQDPDREQIRRGFERIVPDNGVNVIGDSVIASSLDAEGQAINLAVTPSAWHQGGRLRYGAMIEPLASVNQSGAPGIRRLLMDSPVPALVLRGDDHTVVLMNRAAQRMATRTGYIGRSIFDVVPEVAEQGYRSMFDLVLRSGEPISGAAAPLWIDRGLTNGQPERIFYSFNIVPTRDVSGQVDGVVVHVVDVTAQVEAAEKVAALSHVHSALNKVVATVLQGAIGAVQLLPVFLSELGPAMGSVVAAGLSVRDERVSVWEAPAATEHDRFVSTTAARRILEATAASGAPTRHAVAPGHRSADLAHCLGAPIKLDGEVLGALAIARPASASPFTKETEGDISRFADLAALALSIRSLNV